MEFGFPFAPYEIQRQFVRAVHSTLDAGGIALLESPTGTGKTLSLICGTLSWFKKNVYAVPPPESGGVSISDPLQAYMERVRREEAEAERVAQAKHRNKVAKEFSKLASLAQAGQDLPRPAAAKKSKVSAHDDEFLLQDEKDSVAAGLDSDDDDDEKKGREGSLLSEPSTTMRIFYTSRTHSQLKQFCEELRKTGFYCKSPSAQPNDGDSVFSDPQIWTASLGARSALCVVEAVRSLGSAAAVNDACQTRREAKGGCACNKADAVTALAAECMVGGLIDVEELYKAKKKERCVVLFLSI